MTTLLIHTPKSTFTSPIPPKNPDLSPYKSMNPFARPKPPSETFSRATLLPTLPSPQRIVQQDSGELNTPEKGTEEGLGTGSLGSGRRQGWRHLWRGGLEIGPDGWRLDGITFFALLTFPPTTPSVQISNPFDVPIQAFPTPNTSTPNPPTTSPFPSLPSSDTDLCLSLESMRGRKYLQVRGVVDLHDDDVLESSEEGGVQMAISPRAPLLAAYFTTLLCRSTKLSPKGRTLSAVVLGLGDEDVETPQSILIVYGQVQPSFDILGDDKPAQGVLKLCVGRKRPPPPPPSVRKIRPGEPLPRAPLFIPAKSINPLNVKHKAATALSRAQSFSRAPSVNSIYLPPPPRVRPENTKEGKQSKAPVSGRTPGRRGEKRPRPSGEDESVKRRKSGKIVFNEKRDTDRGGREAAMSREDGGNRKSASLGRDEVDEDIFGKRAGSVVPPSRVAFDMTASNATSRPGEADEDGNARTAQSGEPPSTGKTKRIRVPQQVLDNKATIRKQAMLMLEARGCARDHMDFKDVFSMTTKGAYFAFRDKLQQAPVSKADIQPIIKTHLDMYLPAIATSLSPERPARLSHDEGLGQEVVDGNVEEQPEELGESVGRQRIGRSVSEATVLEFIKEEPEDED